MEPEEDAKAHRRKRVRLIQKIYEAYPLICPEYQGIIRVICEIIDQEVITTILTITRNFPINDAHLYQDPEYTWDEYIPA